MTDEDIKSLASRAGMGGVQSILVTNFDELKKFAELVAKQEREECAKLCDGELHTDEYRSWISQLYADAIRKRGNK